MEKISLVQNLKKSITKKIVLTLTVALSLIPFFGYSTHIIGGELNYKCLGGNQYQITLTVYRDCYNGVPPFDDPAAVGIFDVNNVLVTTVYLNFLGSTKVPPTVSQTNPCVQVPTNVCTEVAKYVGTVTLAPRAGGYQLAYQRCCRNSIINNLVNPGNTGATYYAHIPDQSIACNSNPVYKNYPPLFVCANNQLTFDHSATDFEGDSLVYSLCAPLDGASTGNSQPQPPNAPPYNFVTFQAPYSATDPMGGIPLTIDPKTGMMTGTPQTLGTYVVGICVDEYRKGVYISTTKRDFQFNVVNCQPDVYAAAASYTSNCTNHTVTFTNKSTGSTSFSWYFGDPTTLADSSNLTNPTYTYPATGTYTVTLIAYSSKSAACNDTLKNLIVVVDTCKPCGMTLGITKVDAGCGVSTCTTTIPVLDNKAGKKVASNATNINWNHTVTVGGVNSLLIVSLHSITSYAVSVTYAGIPLTLIGQSSSTGGNDEIAEMWYLLAPPTGINAVDVNYPVGTGTFFPEKKGESFSFTNVNQTTPFNLPAGLASGISTCPSYVVTSGANELVLDAISSSFWGAPPLVNAGQTQEYSGTAAFDPGFGGSLLAGAAPNVTMGWTWNNGGCAGDGEEWAAVAVSIKPACSGGPTPGNATVTSLGGSAPFAYSWSPNGGTKATATGLTAGTYTVTVVDAANCVQTASIIIDANSTLTLTSSQTVPTTCGASDGTITVTASGGKAPYTYFWSNGQSTSTATGLSSGTTYSVKIVDSVGCSKSATFTLPQSTIITIATSQTGVRCKGGNTGTASGTATGGVGPYTYVWTTSPVQTTQTTTVLKTGYYVITATDVNGCKGTASITVTDSSLVLMPSKTNVKCIGDNNGTATISVTGGIPGYTYLWKTTPVQTTATATGLSPGTYTVKVTDNAGCVDSTTVTIAQPLLLGLEPKNTTTVNCSGTTNGSAVVVVNGGTGPFSYLWCNGQSTSAASALPPGKCVITVTDANNCVAKDSVTIVAPPALSLTKLSSDLKCNGDNSGSATVNPSGGNPGYTYSWSSSPVQTGQTATGLPAGTYTVVVTDKAGCTASLNNIVINQPTAITFVTASTIANCNTSNGSASITASGGTPAPGYTYFWNSSPVQTTASATGLSAGIYTIVATDGIGCTGKISVTVMNPSAPVPSATVTDVSCNGGNNGSIIGTATGGTPSYKYSWNSSPVQTTANATGLSAGTYILTVTDNSGCVGNKTVTVNQPVVLTLAPSVTNIKCNGANNGTATASVSGGNTGGYLYNWTPISKTTQTVTGLAPGTYTVTATDTKGCSALKSITITQPTKISLARDSVSTTCSGVGTGSASITASGGTPGYTYSWNTNPVQVNPKATNLSVGKYTVTVLDANGCSVTASIAVLRLGGAGSTVAKFDVNIQPTCKDGVYASFTNLSTSATSYLWIFGDGTTSTDKDPTHGYTYGTTVTVKLIAFNGACSDTLLKVITINAFNNYVNSFVPNVFTPNGDGVNDCFEIKVGNGLENCVELTVFDRWGLKMYDNENGTCWDGKTKSGKSAPEGTYFYLIKIGDNQLHGALSLLR